MSLEAMAAKTAEWWVAARKGWEAFRGSGATIAEATKDMLKRYPYLLSVPIQKSAEHDDGRLAEGYALLLEHVEKQEEGFVKEALTRLNPQFTTRGKDETYQLAQELYLYVVAEGRLYKTYPDFIKDVMTRAVPEPGFWVQGGLTEGTGDTATSTRVDPAGTEALKLKSLTDSAERAAPKIFAVTLGPLTTRFFKVEAGELPDPPDVEIKLKQDDTASDRAWIMSVPFTGTPEPPKKHKAAGTVIPELGKQHRRLWIGVFNADTNDDKSYELTITRTGHLGEADTIPVRTQETVRKARRGRPLSNSAAGGVDDLRPHDGASVADLHVDAVHTRPSPARHRADRPRSLTHNLAHRLRGPTRHHVAALGAEPRHRPRRR
jgi:hypothetical protein